MLVLLNRGVGRCTLIYRMSQPSSRQWGRPECWPRPPQFSCLLEQNKESLKTSNRFNCHSSHNKKQEEFFVKHEKVQNMLSLILFVSYFLIAFMSWEPNPNANLETKKRHLLLFSWKTYSKPQGYLRQGYRGIVIMNAKCCIRPFWKLPQKAEWAPKKRPEAELNSKRRHILQYVPIANSKQRWVYDFVLKETYIQYSRPHPKAARSGDAGKLPYSVSEEINM